MLHARRRYIEPSPETCLSCPLHGFCSRLGLDRVAPPYRPRPGLEAAYRTYIRRISAAAALGAVVLAACGIALTGRVDPAVAGAAIAMALAPATGSSRGSED